MDIPLFDTVALLLLGWLLGLLGPIITEAIKRRRENRIGRRAILAELNDTGFKVLTGCYAVAMYSGKLSEDAIARFKAQALTFDSSAELQSFNDILARLSGYSKEQLENFALVAKSEPGRGAVLQKYAIPLLDSRVSALWTFDTQFTRALLDIRVSIDLLNDIVDRSRKYSDMTFQELSQLNRLAVNKNIDECYDLYRERGSKVVSQIAALTGRKGEA